MRYKTGRIYKLAAERGLDPDKMDYDTKQRLMAEASNIVKEQKKNPYAAAQNTTLALPESTSVVNQPLPIVNNKGVAYPEILDLKTGKNMVFPNDVGSRIPKENRVGWYRNQHEANLNRVNSTDILCKKDFIDEWYRQGFTTPEGGWDLYEIHHIKPREFGGSASFENMTPILTNIHRKIITPWWNNYG